MTSEKLSEIIGMIDEDIIAAADKSRAEVKRSKKPLWIGVCSTAACAALITAVALTDPASYLSGESIVDPDHTSTSAATTTDTLTGDNSAGSIITDGEPDSIGTFDGVGIFTEEAIETADSESTKHGATDITGDAPDVIETADIVVDDVPDEEEIGDIEEVVTDTNDAPAEPEELPVSYYPDDTARMLFWASYPTMAKHPDLYEFSSEAVETADAAVDTLEPVETADADVETCDCVEDAIEETCDAPAETEPKNENEAWDRWKKSKDALAVPKETVDELRDFFTRSMQTYLTSAEGENNAYSPVNMYMALSVLSATTEGESREQILSLLNAQSEDELLENARQIWNGTYMNDGITTSVLANSLWLRNDLHYDSNTLKELSETLRTTSYVGEMGSEEYNRAFQRWLRGQSGGRLDNSADNAELSENTAMMLASTLDFSAQWIKSDTFDESDTLTSVFHGADGDVIVEYLNKAGDMTCYFGEGYTAVYLECDEHSMWFVLPDVGVSPEEIAAGDDVYDMVFGGVNAWENRQTYDVVLSLPKFDITAETDLKQGMMALGVTDVFDAAKADFSALTEDAGSYLNKAEQAVRVSIDEKGCAASSFTLMENIPTGGPVCREVIELIFDRPFMFIIESKNNIPLFGGIVNELQPTQNVNYTIKADISQRRYENVELMEQSVTGAPQSYEELHDYLSVYSDRLNFIQYKITAQYTPEEAYALTGDDIYIYATTLYQAKATYDLMNGEPLDYSFFLSDAGTAEEQTEGMPLLSVGERYASVLTGGGKDRQYVAFPELTFAVYRQGAEDYAYHLHFDRIRFIKPDGTDIDLGVSADEEYVITSTGNNPAHYVHKYELSELTEFFRADWTKRGYKFPPLFKANVSTE